MIKMETKLSGDLEGIIEKFGKDIQEKVAFSGAAAMANVIYGEARIYVPVDEGTLRDAIYRVFAQDRSSETVKTYHVSYNKTKAPHGHLIEFGTSRAPAQPFMRPAADHMNQAIAVGKARMQERLEELGGEQ